ncbi:hypothetical protein BOTBODRAFT_42149 [Botryobasidium botryosum FD-172 SS1]|uniref:Uncharacterized protein n=1 Tax=Botryobasidium botryosum (strain FD-172 SS1) TaxID=930990 RepID=A0A067N3T0_BOTB1|nr:hypothetical protein BOTBODRAFT_42149 [Botryobasidium botryosum FD-172 SS1]
MDHAWDHGDCDVDVERYFKDLAHAKANDAGYLSDEFIDGDADDQDEENGEWERAVSEHARQEREPTVESATYDYDPEVMAEEEEEEEGDDDDGGHSDSTLPDVEDLIRGIGQSTRAALAASSKRKAPPSSSPSPPLAASPSPPVPASVRRAENKKKEDRDAHARRARERKRAEAQIAREEKEKAREAALRDKAKRMEEARELRDRKAAAKELEREAKELEREQRVQEQAKARERAEEARREKVAGKQRELGERAATRQEEQERRAAGLVDLIVYIEVQTPPRTVAFGRGVRVERPPPNRFGPLPLAADTMWDDFLPSIATAVSLEPAQLPTDTFVWSPTSTASGGLPVTDETGFIAMHKIAATKGHTSVVIRMSNSIKKFHPVFMHEGEAPPPGPPAPPPGDRRPPIDQNLDAVVDRIRLRYPIGLCEQHPTIHCARDEATTLHYNLDQPKLAVWAHKIINDNGSIDEVPTGSMFFCREQAIKGLTASSSVPPPHPDYPPPPPGYFSNGPYTSASPGPYWPMPYPMQPPFYQHQPPVHAPPPPPPPPTPSTDPAREWALQVGLDRVAARGLITLQFNPSTDDLASVTEQEYKEAGLTSLSWTRVMVVWARWKAAKEVARSEATSSTTHN